MMNTSDQINEIAAALAKAQTQIEHAAKDRQNPAFRQSYATLAAVDDAARPHLAANGIAVVSAPTYDDARKVVSVETRLIHSSGQWLGTSCSAPVAKADAQGIGSAITYLRRYTLSALAGVAPGDDDDGNAAVGRGNQRDDRQPEPKRDEPKPKPAAKPTDAPASDKPAPADPMTALRGVGWEPEDVEALGAKVSDTAALRDLFARARGGWRPDNEAARKADPVLHLVHRRAKRLREATRLDVKAGIVERFGAAHKWDHPTVDAVQADLDALKASIASAGGAA